MASYIKTRRGLPEKTSHNPPIVIPINITSRQAARRVSSIEGLKLGKSLLCVALFRLYVVENHQRVTSSNPKSPTEGIAENHARQVLGRIGLN